MDKKLIVKRVDHAFGKDVFLLGKDSSGQYLWLEKARWDCGWYWGFGYIETYTNNKQPHLSRDISSHSHWENGITGSVRGIEKYIHHLNENPEIVETVLNEKESWEVSDLLKTFYTLKSAAELFHSGSSHLTSVKSLDLTDKTLEDKINQDILPKVFEAVYKILTPAVSK